MNVTELIDFNRANREAGEFVVKRAQRRNW
jgi:hypothetical protein